MSKRAPLRIHFRTSLKVPRRHHVAIGLVVPRVELGGMGSVDLTMPCIYRVMSYLDPAMIPVGSPPSPGMSPVPKLHILPLNALKSKSEFIMQTSATTHAPPALIHGVWNTLSLLESRSTSLSYAPTHCTLVASLDGNKAELASHTLSFLEELTRASYELASTLLCSSVLTGRTSESDEYGDVGLWIGDLKHGTAAEVLTRLGLDSWLKQGAKVGLGSGLHPLCVFSQRRLLS